MSRHSPPSPTPAAVPFRSEGSAGATLAAGSGAPFEIRPVRSRQELNHFIRLPWRIYADDPAWVPPLLLERKEHFSPKNPYFSHADHQLWLAWRENLPVGRISAQIDRLHLDRYQDATGFFGMIEGGDDPVLFRALLAEAEGWLSARGMERVRGPFNFSINQECGLLVEGFDTPPKIMMGHNPSYYPGLVEAAGYDKAKDLLAYLVDLNFPPPLALPSLKAKLEGRVSLRPMRFDRFEEDLGIIQAIFEDAWSSNWGFVPFTWDEFADLGKNLKLLVEPWMVRIAELDGEPVAMMMAFPDLNEIIGDLDGRLLPFGWLKLLWRLKVSRPSGTRVPLMGVRRRYQRGWLGAALALMLIVEIRDAAVPKGFRQAELSWILEDNRGMNNILEAIGSRLYKRYRIYEKTLS